MWQTFLSQSCCVHCIYKVPFLSLPFTASLYDLWGYLFSYFNNINVRLFKSKIALEYFFPVWGIFCYLVPGLNTRSRIIGELRGMFRWPPSYPLIQGVVHIYVTKVVFSPTQCLKRTKCPSLPSWSWTSSLTSAQPTQEQYLGAQGHQRPQQSERFPWRISGGDGKKGKSKLWPRGPRVDLSWPFQGEYNQRTFFALSIEMWFYQRKRQELRRHQQHCFGEFFLILLHIKRKK